MKKLFLLPFLFFGLSAVAQNYSRAKILTDSYGLQTLAELGVSVDHGTVKRETFFISDFSDVEIATIKSAGFTVEILIQDVQAYYRDQNKNPQASTEKNINCNTNSSGGFNPTVPSNFNLGSMGGFLTYQEFLDEIDAMAALYPNLISSKAQISTFQSIEGRPIYWLRLSDNPNTDEAEPEVLYTAVHHAREPNSLSETIFYMWYLLENYGTSEEIQFLVDNTEMYFVPMINPDGYIYNETTNPNGGGLWRKNRRLNSGGSYGVDLNRNYSYGWGTTGTSPNQTNDTYPGTGAFSEPETQAIKWFCENRDFQYAFNAHTYGNDLLYPIGSTTNEFAVDNDYFNAYSQHMAQYNGYTFMKSSSLYPASGDSDDYMYKVDTVIKPKIFAMTPEVSNNSGGFWPTSAQITPNCVEMVFPNLILSHLTHRYLAVTDTDSGTIPTLSGSFNHSALRLGLENGPVNITITPLLGIQSVGGISTHDIALNTSENGSISYVLNPGIQFGDVIKYVLNTEYVGWTHHDTITKTYGAITTQVTDDATTITNWTGNWGTTTSTFVSPSTSFADSPTGSYSNNANRTWEFVNTIDLTNVTAAGIKYFAKWDIENDYDYCQFQVSTDNGVTWVGQCGNYTNLGTSANGSVQPNNQPIYDGVQSTWVAEEINLSDYIGQTIKVRFVLKADGGVNGDGFFFDDFQIAYNIDDAGLAEKGMDLMHLNPNPANQTAYLNFDQDIFSGTVTIRNQNGETVQVISNNSQTKQIKLETAALASGVYYVQFEDGSVHLLPKKLIVIH